VYYYYYYYYYLTTIQQQQNTARAAVCMFKSRRYKRTRYENLTCISFFIYVFLFALVLASFLIPLCFSCVSSIFPPLTLFLLSSFLPSFLSLNLSFPFGLFFLFPMLLYFNLSSSSSRYYTLLFLGVKFVLITATFINKTDTARTT